MLSVLLLAGGGSKRKKLMEERKEGWRKEEGRNGLQAGGMKKLKGKGIIEGGREEEKRVREGARKERR